MRKRWKITKPQHNNKTGLNFQKCSSTTFLDNTQILDNRSVVEIEVLPHTLNVFVLQIHLTLESALLEPNPEHSHPKQIQLLRMINVHLE